MHSTEISFGATSLPQETINLIIEKALGLTKSPKTFLECFFSDYNDPTKCLLPQYAKSEVENPGNFNDIYFKETYTLNGFHYIQRTNLGPFVKTRVIDQISTKLSDKSGIVFLKTIIRSKVSEILKFSAINKHFRQYIFQIDYIWRTLAKKILLFDTDYHKLRYTNAFNPLLFIKSTTEIVNYVMRFYYMPNLNTKNCFLINNGIKYPLFTIYMFRNILDNLYTGSFFQKDQRVTVMFNIMNDKENFGIMEIFQDICDNVIEDKYELKKFIESVHIVPTFEALENSISYIHQLTERAIKHEAYKKTCMNVHQTEQIESSCSITNLRTTCYAILPNIKKHISVSLEIDTEVLLELLQQLNFGYTQLKDLYPHIHRNYMLDLPLLNIDNDLPCPPSIHTETPQTKHTNSVNKTTSKKRKEHPSLSQSTSKKMRH